MTDDDFRMPSADERTTIRRALDGLKESVRQFTRSGRAPFDPRVLDEAHAAWIARRGTPAGEDAMLTALGFALGQHLVDAHKFRWIVLDDTGADGFAVQGGPDDAVIVRPVALVRESHAAGGQRFFAPLAEKIRREAT